MCETSDSTVSETGFWKQASFGGGEVVRMEPIRLCCFAPGIQELARHIFGKWRDSLEEANTADS